MLIALCVFTIVGSLLADASFAETYIAGQFGVAFPRDVTSETITNAGAGTTMGAGVDYKTSAAYGVKLGHYLNRMRYLGFEADYTHSNPHLKGKGGVPGEHFRVDSIALNLLARYPGEKFQPYVGIGPAIMVANINDTATPGNSTQWDSKLGFNAEAGVRYLLFRNVALFGEWKYQKANFHYRETPTLNSFQAPYAAQHLMFGVAWNFESLFRR
jgi:opacity protein-like surface antigen